MQWNIERYYSLTPLSIGDCTFIYAYPEDAYNISVILKFHHLNADKFIETFKQKGIKNIDRLRSIRCTFNYEFWWKRLSFEEALAKFVV